MLWKNLAVLIGFAWVTTTFAAGKIAGETMDDALNHKIEHSKTKATKRGVANEEGRSTSSEDAGSSDPQYWNWDQSAEQESADHSFEPSVEDESEF